MQNISGGGHLKLINLTINCAVTGVRLTDGIGTADLENLTITTRANASKC